MRTNTKTFLLGQVIIFLYINDQGVQGCSEPNEDYFAFVKWIFNSSTTLGLTSEGLGEMFEGDVAEMWAAKFPLMMMGLGWGVGQ